MAGVVAQLLLQLGHRRARALAPPGRLPVDAGVDTAVVDGLFEDGQQLSAIPGLPVIEFLRHPDPAL